MATNTTHCYDMPTFDMTMPMTHTGVATNTMIKPERASSMLTAKLDTLRHVTVCLRGCNAVTMRKLRNMMNLAGTTNAALLFQANQRPHCR